MGSESLTTTHPGPGLAEQDTTTWWPATCSAMQRAMAGSGLVPEDIKGIGLDATASTIVLLDDAARPLAPAALWMDMRAADEAAATAIGHPMLRYSGGSDAAEWMVPKAMWFKRHRPEIWAKAAHVVEALDYLTWMLTGEWVGSVLTTTCKWNYDPLRGSFDAGLFEALGIAGPAGQGTTADRPDRQPCRSADRRRRDGPRTPSQRPHRSRWGRRVHGDRRHRGDGRRLAVLHRRDVRGPHARDRPGGVRSRIWGPYPEAFGHGTWLFEGGQVSAGSILTWYKNQVGDLDHERLIAAADRVQPGRTGLLALDFFQGNRTPYRDDRLRGAILGLDLHHSHGHVYQALAEGIAYGTRNSVEAMEAIGAHVSEIVIAGGIRRNRTWLKATADVLQRPLVIPAETEASVFGTAVIASVAAGAYPSLQDAVGAMVRRERVVEPDPMLRDTYDEGFSRYRAVVDAAGDTLRQLAALARL